MFQKLIEFLEVGSFSDVSAPYITAKMREYKGEPSDLIVEKIPPPLVGNAIDRRPKLSKESSNGLTPVPRSRPRIPVSVSPPSLDNTHVKLFGRWFSQIIPLVM